MKSVRRVSALKQGTLGVVAKPVDKRLRGGAEIDAGSSRSEQLPIFLPDDRSPPGRDHRSRTLDKLPQKPGLEVTESRLTFKLEDLADTTLKPVLEQGVAIRELVAQLSGQSSPYRGFAYSRQSHEADGAPRAGVSTVLRRRQFGFWQGAAAGFIKPSAYVTACVVTAMP